MAGFKGDYIPEVSRDCNELAVVYTNNACYNQVCTLVSEGNTVVKAIIK